jgi:TP901 family phage tail tape measure protein
MADFTVNGDTSLDSSGITSGMSSLSVAAGNLLADLAKAAVQAVEKVVSAAYEIGTAYESSLAKVQSIAQTSEQALSDYSDAVLALSNKTGQAAASINEATYSVISATGLEAADALDVVASASQLATAGFTSTDSAVSALTTAMNAYKLSLDDVDHISDSLITTQNLGVTTVDELASNMGRSIATASAYGISLENLESSYISLTKNGISTAESTTYLSSMFKELGDASSDVGEIIQQKTGKSFGELMNEGYSLGDVLEILSDSVGSNSEALINLWGSAEAGKAASAIASQGIETFNANLETLQTSTGATADAYATMANTMEYQTQVLKTGVQNLGILLYDSMEGNLTQLVSFGNDAVAQLTEALQTDGPVGMAQAAASIVGDLAQSLIDQIPSLMESATEIVSQFCAYIGDHAGDLLDVALQLIGSLAEGLYNNLPTLIESAAQMVTKFGLAILDHSDEILEVGKNLVLALCQGIIALVGNIGEAAIALIARFLHVWDGQMDDWGNIGVNIVSGIVEGIQNAAKNLKQAAANLVDMVKKTLLGQEVSWSDYTWDVTKSTRAMSAAVAEDMQAAADRADEVADKAEANALVINNATKKVTESTKEAAAAAENAGSAASSAARNTASAAKTATTAVQTVQSSTEDLTEAAKTATDEWNELLEALQTTAESGNGAVSTFEDLASALLSQDWKSVAADVGQLLWGELDDDTRQVIADWAVAAVQSLNEGFKNNGVAGLVETGAQIVQSLAQGVSSNSGILMAAAQSLFGDFSGIISTLTTAFPALSGVIQVASGAMAGLNAVMAANPILAIVSVVAILVSALVGLSQTNTTVGKAIRGVWEGLKKVFDVVIDAILLAIGTLLQGWINMINALIWAANLIPGVNLGYVSNPAFALLEKRQSETTYAEDKQQAAEDARNEKISNLNDKINETQSAYKTLSEAAEEYNKNGSISVDTAQEVSQLDSSYLQLLQKNADGTLGVDDTAYQKMLDAQIAALKAAMADGTDLTDALYTLTDAVKDQTDALTGSSLYDLDTNESSAINDYAVLIAAARADALASGVRAASNYTSGSASTTARLNASWRGESTTILELDGREVARATADYMDEELSF